MTLGHAYPTYDIPLTHETMMNCVDVAVRLLSEVGFRVPHSRFLDKIRSAPGLRIDGDRARFSEELTRSYVNDFVKRQKCNRPSGATVKPVEWTVRTAGFSMCVIDMETEKIREATCQDLRDLIKLVNSYGVGGSYPVMPQDLPPILRALACFKICWEMSNNIRPYDYQQPEQTRYVYEMHKVMGKRFDVTLCVPTAMTIDPKDVDVFLDFYPDWKKHRDINFVVLDYPMIGITKPVTIPGCATMELAETLALHILFNLFDPEIQLRISLAGGRPTDLRNACWAFGSPRVHLFHYLSSRVQPALLGDEPSEYSVPSVLLESSSSAVDAQAAMEKMAAGLMGAMQGARDFGYAGVLCVDDVYSGVQFVIDLEIVNHIREMIESFKPHPDVVATEGLYEECKAVSLGNDTFLSHPNTVRRFRNIVPSSDRIVREKLRSWLVHHKTLKDRAREEAVERIRTFEPTYAPEDIRRELSNIYDRAEKELLG